MRYPFIGEFPVTRPFGIIDPVYANYPNSAHSGTDYGVSYRWPYIATMDGIATVYARGNTTIGRGNEVCIKNDNLEVRYCHLDTIYVTEGQRIQEGQQIGTCGWTGYVLPKSPEGAHLHFELLINGVYTDFEQYMKEGQVELLTSSDVDNMWLWMYGTKPSETDYAVWVGKTFKQWAYEKAQYQFNTVHKTVTHDLYLATLHRLPETGAGNAWIGKPMKEFLTKTMASAEWKRQDVKIKAPVEFVPLGQEVFIKK